MERKVIAILREDGTLIIRTLENWTDEEEYVRANFKDNTQWLRINAIEMSNMRMEIK